MEGEKKKMDEELLLIMTSTIYFTCLTMIEKILIFQIPITVVDKINVV